MPFEKRFSLVLDFRHIAPEPVSLVLLSADAEFCLSKREGGFRMENGEEGYRLELLSWRKDGLEIRPVNHKNDLRIRLGVTVAEGVELVAFELSELQEGVLLADLGGMVQKSKGGTIEFSING